MSKIITRLFDSFMDAEHAVIELQGAGVPGGDISLVSYRSDKNLVGVKVREPGRHTSGGAAVIDGGVGAVAGGVVGATSGVLASLGLLVIPGLGPVIAAGWLASAAVGAIVGGAVGGAAGGIVGALTSSGISSEEADVYAEGVRRGGTLVSAKVDDAGLAQAEAALRSVPCIDIAARGAAYRQTGWTGFEEKSPPYSEEEVVAERTKYSVR